MENKYLRLTEEELQLLADHFDKEIEEVRIIGILTNGEMNEIEKGAGMLAHCLKYQKEIEYCIKKNFELFKGSKYYSKEELK